MTPSSFNPLTRFSRTIIALCLVSASLISVVSCDKDEDETEPVKTKSQLLKQKWNLVNRRDTFVEAANNIYSYKDYTGKVGDYYQFWSDGTLWVVMDGHKWADPYKFTESTMSYTFYSQTYQVRELTENKLEIYMRTTMSSSHYWSEHIFLER